MRPILVVALMLIPGCSESLTGFGLADLRQVSAGADHSCASTTAGVVVCWGSNEEGQLGSPGGSSTEPIRAGLLPLKIEVVATGNLATCGVLPSGHPVCWGRQSAAASQPSSVPALAGLSLGREGCGLTASGAAWCWVLPAGSGSLVAGGPYLQLGAGETQNCALLADSTAVCWATGTSIPTAVPGAHHFSHLAVGGQHACGIEPPGNLWCWGSNAHGQLGDGTTVPRSTPVAAFLSGLPPEPLFTAVIAGAEHSCAIMSAGAAYCWGQDDFGQTGSGGETPDPGNYWSLPVAVTGAHTWKALSAGGAHTCGVTTDDAMFCWGSNAAGQLGTGDRQPSSEPVEVVWNP